MHHYAVLGNPINHSKSPRVHHFFAEQTQQRLSYRAIHVEPGDLASSILQFQQEVGAKGLNITAPFKEEAYSLVTHLTSRGRRAKAINTIKFLEDGSLLGDNTDGIGLVRDITANLEYPIKNKTILILGAGGSVRGILEPLLNESPQRIVIANRTPTKELVLISEFGDLGLIESVQNVKEDRYSYDIVINALPPNATLPLFIRISPNALCYELNYAQNKSFLFEMVASQRPNCANGLGMLVEQAAESFNLWRSVHPETKSVIKALRLSSPGLC